MYTFRTGIVLNMISEYLLVYLRFVWLCCEIKNKSVGHEIHIYI